MPDLYTLRNLAMFLYPVYGYFIFRYYHWRKLYIAVAFFILTFWGALLHYCDHRPFSLTKAFQTYDYQKHEEKILKYSPKYIEPVGVGSLGKRESSGEGDRSSNMVFRILIWQDMIKEMIDKKAWFGMGLSHPLRSPQIERLHWAESEWSRDGWISAHNSYLYVIYRIGVFGVACILWLFITFYRKFKEFVFYRDIEGILLCLCFSYWLFRALTIEQFQLPYNAIPMWVVGGLIMKGHYDKRL